MPVRNGLERVLLLDAVLEKVKPMHRVGTPTVLGHVGSFCTLSEVF